MNILPKKSWHVRNKDNIERVRRDEARAAEEEKERQRRIAVAEQEARTKLLRERAQHRSISSGSTKSKDTVRFSSSTDVEVFKEGKHINFWSEFEEGKDSSGGNADYEREKKAEKEKQEQAIGLLTYLGQSSAERLESKPWYHLPPEARSSRDAGGNDKRNRDYDEADKKKKRAHDPMLAMSNYLEKKRKVDEQKHPKDKHKEHHKHKGRLSSEQKKSSGAKSIEQLRAERLQREKAEQGRTEALMAKLRGETPNKEPEPQLDERKLGYNSQFNPELARKWKPKHSYH